MGPTEKLKFHFNEVTGESAKIPRPEEGLFTFESKNQQPDIFPLSLISVDILKNAIAVSNAGPTLSTGQTYSACFHWEPIKLQVRLYGKVLEYGADTLLLSIDALEFWKRKAHRVHERDVYSRQDQGWQHERIYP